MLDFLFTPNQGEQKKLVTALKYFRKDPNLIHNEYYGSWGSMVTIGPAYPGFDPIETEEFLMIVLGGPLPRYDFNVATGELPDDGTRWILNRWKVERKIAWDDDLLGHFLIICVEKKSGLLNIVTDINAFVPVYKTKSSEKFPLIVGSHVDAVAVAAGVEHQIDPVSLVDFFTYKTVTYPYTMYKNVRQLPPASLISVKRDGSLKVEEYWKPKEHEFSMSFLEAAEQLRETIARNIKRICFAQKEVGLLMSGGEDSRVVASLIPSGTKVKAVTFVDSFNREARIAEAVSRRLCIDWHAIIRKPTHYIEHAPVSVALSESQNFFCHAHANGFVHKLPDQVRILGALAFDAFLKGARIKGMSKARIMFKINKNDWKYYFNEKGVPKLSFPSDITIEIKKVEQRRQMRNEQLQMLRPNSWAEWHSLTPATMNTNFTNLIINRRLFISYEPCIDSHIVKLSSAIPQTWKTNRQLFHCAMKPIFYKTWNIPHGEFFYPYFGFLFNLPLNLAYALKRKISWLALEYGLVSTIKNDGPWPIWRIVLGTDKYKFLTKNIYKNTYSFITSVGLDKLLKPLINSDNSDPKQKLSNLHILLWVNLLFNSKSAMQT